jgi:aminomethyltransferase
LPLHDAHVALGARMQPFAGWLMPVLYPQGVLGEHRHTRAAAGLFDVSHMGQILVRARSGELEDAALALETLVPVDVASLPAGRQRYGFLTTTSGGIRDDLMIANLGDRFHLVVNAACAADDFAHLREHLSDRCSVDWLTDRALLAIQGPDACAVLSALLPAIAGMRFMDSRTLVVDGADCYVTRSGYTGEDGFEISLPAQIAHGVFHRLMAHPSVRAIGLGARDSLRLEAGLCLYGHDLTPDTTPVEAGLDWAIQAVRRSGAARAGGFPGSDVILSQLAQGAARRRIGLKPEARPVREGAALFADSAAKLPLGWVTSGTYGPSTDCPVAMGYVTTAAARVGTRLCADVRGQRVPVTVSALPFVPHRYHR